MKAELREARMEAEPLEESGGPHPPQEPPGEHQGRIHPQRRRQTTPCPAPCARWDGSTPDPATTPGATVPAQQQPEEDRTPAVIGARFFADPRPDPTTTGRIRAGPRPPRNPNQHARASRRS